MTEKDATESSGRVAFFEEDQENLYKLVQFKATSGKLGLGIRDSPKEVAGCYFQGEKTSFDGSSDNGEHSDISEVGGSSQEVNLQRLGPREFDQVETIESRCRRVLTCGFCVLSFQERCHCKFRGKGFTRSCSHKGKSVSLASSGG